MPTLPFDRLIDDFEEPLEPWESVDSRMKRGAWRSQKAHDSNALQGESSAAVLGALQWVVENAPFALRDAVVASLAKEVRQLRDVIAASVAPPPIAALHQASRELPKTTIETGLSIASRSAAIAFGSGFRRVSFEVKSNTELGGQYVAIAIHVALPKEASDLEAAHAMFYTLLQDELTDDIAEAVVFNILAAAGAT